MKTPEEIARDLIATQPQRPGVLGSEIVVQRDVLAHAIAASIREAEERGVRWGIAAASERAVAAHWCCTDLECDVNRMSDEIEATDPAEVAEKARGK